MDPAKEEQMQYQGSGTIPALEEQDMMGEDDDYEDLYDGVNVGESFSLYHQSEVPASSNMGNGGDQAKTYKDPETQRDASASQDLGGSGIGVDVRYQNEGHTTVKAAEITSSNHNGINNGVSGNMGFQVPMSQNPANGNTITNAHASANTNMNHANPNANANASMNHSNINANASMNHVNPNAGTNASMNHANVNDHIIRPMENGPTMLFVGELHWWTTDVDLENVLSQYGKVKEIKFFDERATGKSKGYCQVEFYDAAEAAACKEGMNGYMFNGKACLVTFASPQTLRQMGAGYANKNPQQPQPQPLNQGRRNVNEGTGRGGGASFPAGDGGRGNGRGGWRGGAPRGRGGFMGPRNNLGNAGGMGVGPGFGGPSGGMMHPQAMMGPGPGFDPTYMGRGAGYGGFPGPGFPGMMPQFPGINQMGTGMAPHVNPAFFGRGMAPNGMGMMSGAGMEPHSGAMWADPNMSGWTGEEHGQRTMESGYGGDDGASDFGYGEGNPDNATRNNAAPREKEKVSERDYSGTSERRYRDDREQEQDWDREKDRDRDRSDRDRSDRERKYREEKDSYKDNRRKDRDLGYEDDYDRRQSSSRPRSRSRAVVEDDRRTRPRNADYEKRRRAPSE